MSSEHVTARRRKSDTKPTTEVDHRKRRRNRTTQSCLNCHTSKRMCDRKRPACARCTQLGLTGLCVYEVDDPNQRSDSQDESARLLKRVAELEGVIRELKNKPHPRWIQTTSGTPVELEKWVPRTHTRMRSGGGQESGSNVPSPPSSLSDKSEVSSPGGQSTRSASSLTNTYPPTIILNSADRHLSQTASSSSQSTPSPGLITPPNELSSSHISLAFPSEASQEYDLASMFLSYPGLMGYEPTSLSSSLGKGTMPGDPRFQKPSISQCQCGCLQEAASYSVLLELSLRLRKAADVLARSTSHRMGQQCHLHQRISDLDRITSNALGNISTPPEDLSASVMSHSDNPQSSTCGSLRVLTSPLFAHSCQPATSPESLQNMPSWDLSPTVTNSPIVTCEDNFMTWEPSRSS
ncbi:hypothetical protein D9756_005337 [Leucocoprinus leucothites]|uniref:Zn(2)-C6 fungal-type domain-containing protein n=1 Tax=Leucocoprinus leucothites TaxID=201217 RepID=A0A8H5FZN3_9AGAR|nr:hypothetical protein D9756_005337 [Leucoagaricus leucothites]